MYDLRRLQALIWRVGRRRLPLRAILVEAEIAQTSVRSLVVVPLQPDTHSVTGFGKAGEVLLPDALFLETAKEALDQTVLLGRGGREVLLAKPVECTGLTKAPTQEHQPVVAAQYRRLTRRS